VRQTGSFAEITVELRDKEASAYAEQG
jgi:hypothetical protein